MHEVKKQHLLAAIRSGRRFDGEKFADSCGTMRSRDVWLQPFQAPYQHASFDAAHLADLTGGITVSDFEDKAEEARKRAMMHPIIRDKGWPKLKSSVLINALAEATREIAGIEPSSNQALVDFNILSGLQIYGVEIVPDVNFRNGSLNLVNVAFPFSVRLICCVLRVPLALSNVQLVTLDLSGSALVGVDAKFLHARGSVRMRRSFSLGPVDFAGAEIHGYFDASDLLIVPFGPLPADQAVDGDSGILSLNQASIDNEVRLERAEIWGGMSMRGLTTKRSIYLNESRISSPLATLERLFLDQIPKENSWPEIQPGGSKSDAYVVGLETLRSQNVDAFRRAAPNAWTVKKRAIDLYLCENLRVRTSAVRGDGLSVGGSLFAKDMECRGRFRMKYAGISGGLSMQGSSFSSAELQRRSFDNHPKKDLADDASALFDYRLQTYNTLVKKEDRERDALALGSDDFALDLSESAIRGSVRLGLYKRDMERREGRQTQIDGIVAIERAQIGGELVFGRTTFSWTVRARLTDGNEGSAFEDRARAANRERNENATRGRAFAIRAQGITTGDDVSFLDSTGLFGADFSNAEIGGNLSFFEEIRPTKSSDYLEVTHAARKLRGRIKLEVATIAGDCKLIFNPLSGPSIKAEKLSVAQSLQFASRPKLTKIPDPNDRFSGSSSPTTEIHAIQFSAKRFRSAVKKSRETWRLARDAAARRESDWRKWQDRQHTKPMIDLGNARATLLQHPPSAWPRAGRLQISGFRYDRALAFGPLGPHPFSKEKLSSDGPSRIDKFTTFLMGFFGIALIFSFPAYNIIESFNFGRTEMFFLGILLAIGCAVRMVSQTEPNADNTEPMAVEYLKLQIITRNAYRYSSSVLKFIAYHRYRHELNKLDKRFKATNIAIADNFENEFNKISRKFKLSGHVYSSLEPYQVAANALREEGRWTSANIVEQRRQQVRINHLSWRNNPFHKALFHAIRAINKFGFSISQPIFYMLLTICLGSILAHHANANGAIQPKSFRVDAQVPSLPNLVAVPDLDKWSDRMLVRRMMSTILVVEHVRASLEIRRVPQPSPAPGFSPLLFALDKAVPVLDLGQDQDWEIDKARPLGEMCPFSWFSYVFLFAILKIIGLTIVTLLFIALSTRVGSIFGRYKE